MVAAAAPSTSPTRNPSRSTVAKLAASPRPGFQPSPAAQSTASAISSGRITRMRRSLAQVISAWSRLSAQPLSLQRGADLIEDCGIVDRGRHGPGLAIGDLLHGAAQAFPRARLRQPRDRDRKLAGCDRADFFAHETDALLLDLVRGSVDSGLEHDEAAGDFALELVCDADHGAFGDILVRREHLLHPTGREPVAGDVDDVVGAAHDMDVAVFVLEAGIGRL